MPWINDLFRFLIASLGLFFVAFLVPGFSIRGFYSAALTVAVMTALCSILNGLQAARVLFQQSAFSSLGLLTLLLYASQFMIQTMQVKIFSAFIASLLLALLHAALPFKAKYWRTRQ